MLASLTILAYSAASDRMNAANSSGLSPTVSAPTKAIFSLTSFWRSSFTVSPWSLPMTSLATAAEQEIIVETVEDQISIIEHLKADLDAKLRNAQALRQAILRHAFTGQLVPQDPNDEPASKLLECVAAEREARAREAAAAKGNPKRVARRKKS